jgi:hypothetical protein
LTCKNGGRYRKRLLPTLLVENLPLFGLTGPLGEDSSLRSQSVKLLIGIYFLVKVKQAMGGGGVVRKRVAARVTVAQRTGRIEQERKGREGWKHTRADGEKRRKSETDNKSRTVKPTGARKLDAGRFQTERREAAVHRVCSARAPTRPKIHHFLISLSFCTQEHLSTES